MKKKLSILLAGSIILTQCSLAFAEDASEKVLISVKEKISIPAELSTFTTQKETYDEKTSFRFEWSDEDEKNSISVSADSKGHITNYSRYSSDWYKNDSKFVIDPKFDITKLESFSAEELKKMVPELFSDEADCLKQIPFDDNLRLSNQSIYTFNFIREHSGIEVKNNYATITVSKTENGFVVNDADISWDYETEFITPESVIGNDAAQAKLLEKYAPKLSYRKSFDEEKYFLEYIFGENAYIDAQNAEEVNEDARSSYMPYAAKSMNEAAMDSGVSGGGSARITLTPEEIAELENLAGLKTTDELLNTLYSMSELAVKKAAAENINANTYKTKKDNKYITSVSVTENNSENDKKEQPASSIHASFNAATGELLSFYRYSYDDYYSSRQSEKKTDREKAYAFLNKYFSDKASKAQLDGDTEDTAFLVRRVNGIDYTDNYISASWNAEKECIDSFNLTWDDDISTIPAPNNIISANDAAAAAFAKYPVKSLYILSDGKYKQVYTFSNIDTRINAFNSKIVGYDGEEITQRHTGTYSDTEGHWVNKIASELAKYGIAIKGGELCPDAEITQADFLKLVYSGIFGYNTPEDSDYIYRRLINQRVLSEEEINSETPITRENAIRYLLRAMGIREVAEISGIYICDFVDSANISADKFGYCAIAKGFGIVSGSDGYLYPQNNITRAEALVMIYNYLTR